MLRKVKDNFDAGIEKIKWFASLLNERVKVEISLFSLLYQSAEMEKKRAALMRTIGERFFELRNSSEKHLLKDPAILDAIKTLDRLDSEMEDVRKKASEIEKLEA